MLQYQINHSFGCVDHAAPEQLNYVTGEDSESDSASVALPVESGCCPPTVESQPKEESVDQDISTRPQTETDTDRDVEPRPAVLEDGGSMVRRGIDQIL